MRTAVVGLLVGASTAVAAPPVTVTWDADPATAGVQNGAGLWTDSSGAMTTNWWDGTQNVAYPSIKSNRGDVVIGDAAASGSSGAVTFGKDSTVIYAANVTVVGSGWSIGNSATYRSSIDFTGTYTVGDSITQNGALIGSGSLVINGGTFTPGFRAGLSTFTGSTTINNAIVPLTGLTNAGGTVTSALGIPTTPAASGLVLNGATLRLSNVLGSTDTNATTNRLFTLGTGGAVIEANGVGSVKFTNTGAIAFSGSGARELVLGGTNNTKVHQIAPAIGDAAVGSATSVRKTGVSTWALTGENTYSGATTIAGGTLQTSGTATTNILTNAGGVELAAGTKLVLDYTGGTSPVASVKSLLDAEFAAPAGFASGQIRTPVATGSRGLGYADNGVSAVTITYTLYGDADLDGDVDFNDFLALQANFGTAGTRFDQGNFNYDGLTDFNDFLVLQSNFGQSVTGADVAVTAGQLEVLAAFASANAVPEPTSLAVLALAGIHLATRRRSR
ncbi:MAG: autotransporter-associated beta strand repeat-containing protein [Tepidisphaeraceae bacterium]